jgi:hypothetical protein
VGHYLVPRKRLSGFVGTTARLESQMLADFPLHKVKPLSPNHRFMIAMHSPRCMAETGLPRCPAEKKVRKCAGGAERGPFSGAV